MAALCSCVQRVGVSCIFFVCMCLCACVCVHDFCGEKNTKHEWMSDKWCEETKEEKERKERNRRITYKKRTEEKEIEVVRTL